MPSLRAKVPLIELCYPNFLRRHCQSCNLTAESITLHILQGFLNPNWLLLMLWTDLSRIVMKIACESGAVINHIPSMQTLPLPSDFPHLILRRSKQGGKWGWCLKFERKKSSKCGWIQKFSCKCLHCPWNQGTIYLFIHLFIFTIHSKKPPLYSFAFKCKWK